MPDKKLYFLHIPKTSGIKMQYELLDASNKTSLKNKAKVYSQDANRGLKNKSQFEFVFDPQIADSHNIICGHFARNPIGIVDNLITFSIIREPFEQYVSLAKYAAKQSSIDFDEEFLELFLSNDNEINTSFEGMTGCENPQSCFLYSKISSVEQIVGVDDIGNFVVSEDKSIFVEKPNSYKDLEQRIDGIIIGTLEKRHLFIDKINTLLSDLFGMHIDSNEEVINSTPALTFKIGKRHREMIRAKTEIDSELYYQINKIWS